MRKLLEVLLSLLTVMVVLGTLQAKDPTYEPADSPKKIGLGIALGAPSGLDARFWLSRWNAVDIVAGVGYSNFWAQATYLWHYYDLFKDQPNMPVYYGVGGFMGGAGATAAFGAHFTVGLDYIFKKEPFDIFVEAGPAVAIAPTAIYFHGGLGARFYLP